MEGRIGTGRSACATSLPSRRRVTVQDPYPRPPEPLTRPIIEANELGFPSIRRPLRNSHPLSTPVGL